MWESTSRTNYARDGEICDVEIRPAYCCHCGMPNYDGISVLGTCKHCGSAGPFSLSLLLISWDVALTWADKQMLKRLKISPK